MPSRFRPAERTGVVRGSFVCKFGRPGCNRGEWRCTSLGGGAFKCWALRALQWMGEGANLPQILSKHRTLTWCLTRNENSNEISTLIDSMYTSTTHTWWWLVTIITGGILWSRLQKSVTGWWICDGLCLDWTILILHLRCRRSAEHHHIIMPFPPIIWRGLWPSTSSSSRYRSALVGSFSFYASGIHFSPVHLFIIILIIKIMDGQKIGTFYIILKNFC